MHAVPEQFEFPTDRARAQHHVTPHQMRMARRLFAAKQWLAQGIAPAQVAAMAGLTGQRQVAQ